MRHLRGWRSISSGQLPVPILVPSAEDPSNRIAALCLGKAEHTQQLGVVLGATHRLIAVTQAGLVGWVTAAAPVALSLGTLPQNHAVLVGPGIPHTFAPRDDVQHEVGQFDANTTPSKASPFVREFVASSWVLCCAVVLTLVRVLGQGGDTGRRSALPYPP